MTLAITNKRINMIFVLLAVIFSLISLYVAVQETFEMTAKQLDYYYRQLQENPDSQTVIPYEQEYEEEPVPIWITLISALGFVFQIIVCYQWAVCINHNITETQSFFFRTSSIIDDEEEIYDFNWMIDKLNTLKINLMPFWMYLVFSILGIVIPGAYLLFSILGFASLAYYLNKLFILSGELSDIKSQFFGFYLKSDYEPRIENTIKPRNIIYFLLFSIFTMGLYWYYLIFKLSMEINLFLNSDEILRSKLSKLKKQENLE